MLNYNHLRMFNIIGVRFRTFVSVVAVMCGMGCIDTSAASGGVSKYELNVKDFSQLIVDDGFNVEYRSSDELAGMAVFETTKKIADKIIFENNNKGKLVIQKAFHEEGEMVSELPTITVYSRFLKEVKNNGDSTLRVLSVRPTMDFKATVIGNGRMVVRGIDCSKFEGAIKTGNGSMVVTGKCESAVLSNTGTGAIQADDLEAVNVSCRFFGTGTTGCWASGVLTVKGVMAGKLYYRDTPQRIRNYSVGVKIYSLEGTEWTGEQAGTPEEGEKE